ncbi:MAG: LON peptidase substrate-binding domain-containing protein [Alphaproteobacteria bacterium]|nr:LON peptidase substrate-binding domain-containing protein [Alphaproteobacteria bacterium]
MNSLDPQLNDFPAAIPVFPLPEVLLLPGGTLPLNIFEPRYLSMVEAALGADRMIGVIQPLSTSGLAGDPPLYDTGCAGRISRFEETPDGRFLISLKGVCRFDIAEELAPRDGYRRVQADWSPYKGDLEETESRICLNRGRLFPALRNFFKLHGIEADWETLGEAPDERLVTCLSMICPFGAAEKQALLEAPGLDERSEILTTLIEMGAGQHDCSPVRQ